MPNVERLVKKLESCDTEERREAAIALGRLGHEAVPLLLRAMSDADWRVRKTAVEALVQIGGELVVDGLIQALNAADNAGVRNSAIEALTRMGGPIVDTLLRNAEVPDPDVRKFIVDILGDIKDPRAVPALINRLADADENVSVASAEALGKIRDPRALDALLSCLARHEQGWLDYAAAEALGAIGDERALEPLLAALSRSSLREPILESLGKIGNAETIGPLVSSLGDPLRIVREVSIVAIVSIYGKSGPPQRLKIIDTVRAGLTAPVVDSLEEILITSSGDLQKATIALLGWAGKESSIRKLLSFLKEEEFEDPLVQALQYLDRNSSVLLLEYLTHENALVRRTAAKILGDLGIAAAEDPLIRLLRDENGHVRSTAALALGRLRSRKASAPLLELLTDEYESVQETAIQALAAIGDESVLDSFIRNFSAHTSFMRKNIVLLLGKFSSERAIDALAFALKDEEHDVRKAVVQVLANVPGEKVLRSLLLAITDDNPEVRMLAAEALGRNRTSEARDALLPLLNDDDIWVRAAACRGLGEIGGDRVVDALVSHLGKATEIFLLAIINVLGNLKSQKARDPLRKFVDHPDPEVRKTVLAALDAYGASLQEVVIARLSDPHWSVRKMAVEVLRHQRSATVDELLSRIAAEDPDATVRQAAKEAVGI